MNAPHLKLVPPPPPAAPARPELRVADLSPDQRTAYAGVVKWAKERPMDKQVLILTGVAGSGKSSLLGLLAREPGLGPMAFATPTGKAASVLRRKLEASGIRTRGRLRRNKWGKLFDEQDADAVYVGTIHALAYVPVEEKETGKVTGFGKQDSLDETYKFLVVDESSMISQDTLDHLKGYGIPVLLVGDHAQLPPVRSSGSVILRPDFKLDKIHRQAEGNPILALSARIRATGEIDASLADGDRVKVLPSGALRDVLDEYESLKSAPPASILARAMITFTNRRRKALNAAVRDRLGRSGAPSEGDVTVCLKNLHRMPIYNGMRGLLRTVEGVEDRAWLLRGVLDFPEDDLEGFSLGLSALQFGREKTFEEFAEVDMAIAAAGHEGVEPIESWSDVGRLFDFGYVMTGHKMQGSQAEDVCVVAERPGPVSDADWTAWLYTTCTRASERLTVIL